ncbi:MAG: hypothetical protein KJ559_02485 [Nanoarchaeota archaeon]|nr:hypothetical protein [Nanoarchaeota archaeon]
MKNFKKLKEKLEKKKNKIGLVGTSLELTDDLTGDTFLAYIQNDWKKIRMDYQKNLDLIPDKETEDFARKSGIKDPEEKIGEDILEHECGHRENRARTTLGCPYDVQTHDRIKSETARALKEKGKESQTDYVTNAFEDILNNINCRNYTDFSGQTLFWNNQGLTKSQDKKYNPFYEAFVRINLFLGKEAKSHTLLSRFFSDDKKVMPAVKSFLEDICRESEEASSIRFNEKPGFKRLFTTDLNKRMEIWERLAYSFASKTADLLENILKEKMFGSGNGNSSGKEQKDSGNGQGSDKEDSGNPFDKEMQDPQVQEKLAMGRYQSGKGPSYHADLQEQLYALYKSISREIQIETSSFSSSQSMPLVHFGKRFLTENDKKIKFKGIGFNSEGKLEMKTARNHIDFPATYKKHPAKFPNLKIAVMDRSGSMSLNPDNECDSNGPINIGDTSFIPWGDRSKYHFALKGYFGIDNYLERQGVAPFMDCSVVGLSGEGIIKGKSKEVAKKLLHKPEGMHTSLNASQLENELSQSALLVSISDGEISMPRDTSSLDEKLKKSDYIHIQIGRQTNYSNYVQNLGKPVVFVKGDNDLSRIMVKFVSDYYQLKGQEK